MSKAGSLRGAGRQSREETAEGFGGSKALPAGPGRRGSPTLGPELRSLSSLQESRTDKLMTLNEGFRNYYWEVQCGQFPDQQPQGRQGASQKCRLSEPLTKLLSQNCWGWGLGLRIFFTNFSGVGMLINSRPRSPAVAETERNLRANGASEFEPWLFYVLRDIKYLPS